MEVHHPPHITHKKKWTEYLLEFFMLFLAVFLGFVAENIRENSVERHREKEYMASLIEDIKLDTADINRVIKDRRGYIDKFDSLVKLLNMKPQTASTGLIYYYSRFLTRSADFVYHNRTTSQLKNSGALRLVQNKIISDSITLYENDVIGLLTSQQDFEKKSREHIRDIIGKVLDAAVFETITDSTGSISLSVDDPKLLTTDPTLINELSMQVHYLKTAYRITMGYFQTAMQRATSLLSFLQKEYHL